MESITTKLYELREKSARGRKEATQFMTEDPFHRTKRLLRLKLAIDSQRRTEILKSIPVFMGMSDEAYETIVNLLEENEYAKGYKIFSQGDVGDAFYIIESGQVSVKYSSKGEAEHEVAQLGPGKYFGENALIQNDLRGASIYVISELATCLKMTKQSFLQMTQGIQAMLDEQTAAVGLHAVERVELFKKLSPEIKKNIVAALSQESFAESAVICRQGTIGDVFYIITDGQCDVTLDVPGVRGGQQYLSTISVGDFFGELALVDKSSRRKANVIAKTEVKCMTLSREDFNELFKADRELFMGGGKSKPDRACKKSESKQRRRISCLSDNGRRSAKRIGRIFSLFSRFTVESLWNSLYSRMYREILLSAARLTEYGDIAQALVAQRMHRNAAVAELRQTAQRVLSTDGARRSHAEMLFTIGLMSQKNVFKDEFCADWPASQFAEICKRVRIVEVPSLRTLYEYGTKGSSAFIILRGAVRIFAPAADEIISGEASNLIHSEDLASGEMFGETALHGLTSRLNCAVTMTPCDLAVVRYEDIEDVMEYGAEILSADAKFNFLRRLKLFDACTPQQVHHVANVLIQQIRNKGTKMKTKEKCADMFFIINGRVDVTLPHPHLGNLTIAAMEKGEFYGEKALIDWVKLNRRELNENYDINKLKFDETNFELNFRTKVNLLVLQPQYFRLIESSTVDIIVGSVLAKKRWRRLRIGDAIIGSKERRKINLVCEAGSRTFTRPIKGSGSDDDDDDDDDDNDARQPPALVSHTRLGNREYQSTSSKSLHSLPSIVASTGTRSISTTITTTTSTSTATATATSLSAVINSARNNLPLLPSDGFFSPISSAALKSRSQQALDAANPLLARFVHTAGYESVLNSEGRDKVDDHIDDNSECDSMASNIMSSMALSSSFVPKSVPGAHHTNNNNRIRRDSCASVGSTESAFSTAYSTYSSYSSSSTMSSTVEALRRHHSQRPKLHRVNELAENVNPLMLLSVCRTRRQVDRAYQSLNAAKKQIATEAGVLHRKKLSSLHQPEQQQQQQQQRQARQCPENVSSSSTSYSLQRSSSSTVPSETGAHSLTSSVTARSHSSISTVSPTASSSFAVTLIGSAPLLPEDRKKESAAASQQTASM